MKILENIQKKINDNLKKELENLRLSNGAITNERDTLLKENEILKRRIGATESYQDELKQEIVKTKEIQQQYTDAIAEVRAIGKKYGAQMKTAVKETKRDFKRNGF